MRRTPKSFRSVEALVIDQAIRLVGAGFMLPGTFGQVAGDAGVERPAAVAHDVDVVELLLEMHRSLAGIRLAGQGSG